MLFRHLICKISISQDHPCNISRQFTFCNPAKFAPHLSITATDMLNDQVVPFFDAEQIPLLRILTDRGTEYCDTVERHSYRLYLAMEDIVHSRTKANHPQTNGICERFHRIMKNEIYDIAFRKKTYGSMAGKIQRTAASFRETLLRKTPMQTFREARHLVRTKTTPATIASDSLHDQTQFG